MQNKNKPKAFNIYCDTYEHVELLDMQERGELLTALYDYANSGKRPEFKNAGLRMAFSFMRSQMDRDFAKYEARCEHNRAIAQKRKANRTLPNVTTGNQYKEKEEEKKEEKEEEKKEEKEKEEEKNKNKNKEKASAGADAVSADDVLTLYQSICKSLPKVSALTENDVRMICLSPEVDFREYFARVERSDFLTGRSGRWKGCTLQWLLRPDTVAKVMNGYYDDRPKDNGTSYDLRELERIDTLDWIH